MVSLVTICVRFSVTSIPSISTITSIAMPKMSKSPIISIICVSISVCLRFSFGYRFRCGVYINNGKYKAQGDQITLKIEKKINYIRISHSTRQHHKIQGTKRSNNAMSKNVQIPHNIHNIRQRLPRLQLWPQVQVWYLQKQWQIQSTTKNIII